MEVTKAEIHRLDENIQTVDRKVSSILSILSGNELDKEDKGLIGTLNHLDERVSKLEKFKDRAMWFVIGLSVPAGFGIADIVTRIFTKS